MRTIAKISGGVGSYSAARRYVDQHGSDELELLFTDTLFEDQDAYRFLVAGAANLFGVELPDGFLPEIADFPAWEDRLSRLRQESLWLPRLNSLGFAHNNCGGFCCKGGQGHWKLMLKTFPERYAYSEQREQEIRGLLGDVSMLTDRRGGNGKKPLTLEALRTRDLRPDEAAEMGACGCYFGDAA